MIEGHGDDIYRYGGRLIANFSSNVWSGMDHRALHAHLRTCNALIKSYPEPRPYSFEAELASSLHLAANQVCATNGATEGIYLLAHAFAGRRSAILQPTFTEYADACRMHGHRLSSFFQLDQLPAEAEVVWICNPNNPTGECHDPEMLRQLIQAHPQTYFIIDHSYEAFTRSPLIQVAEAAAYPNVYLIHSFTKRFAIPGLRLGYITAAAANIDRLMSYKMPWSVNVLAIEAGKFLLRNSPEFGLSQLLTETDRVASALKAISGIEVANSTTHFLLCRLRSGKAAALKEYLARERGLLIRDASNFEGLDASFFRIATQEPEANDLLINALKQWI